MKNNYTPTLFPQLEDSEFREHRYSLPKILEELKHERASSYFAKEILDQIEISKIFDGKRIARVNS